MENIEKRLDRARRTAMGLATACIVFILVFIYTFIQKKSYEREVKRLSAELELCKNK